MTPARTRIDGHEHIPIDSGWQAASATPDTRPDPGSLEGLEWLETRVPGTAAGAMREAGRTLGDLDAADWWFRVTFEAMPATSAEEVVLCFGGIATLAEVFLNGESLLTSESMFADHAVDVGSRLRGTNELLIRCRALTPQVAVQRKPRARWRTRLVADNNLRWFRTMLLGRIPGFAAGPAAVGPWRPVWLERRRRVQIDDLALRPRLDGDDGLLVIDAAVRGIGGFAPDAVGVEVSGPTGVVHASLTVSSNGDAVTARGTVRVPAVQRWWPHTHGDPVTYAVRLFVESGGTATSVDAGRVGFRDIAPGPTADHDIDRDGLDLQVNGIPIFVRGALWTPLDIVGLAPSVDDLRTAILAVRDAGMNMLRVPGVGAYEQAAFHDLCDEQGILVWQDLMYASMDYPFVDDRFRAVAEAEARAVVARIGGRPSTAVVCGSSEIEQQVAMLGLDLGLARIPFFDTTVPAILAAADVDAVFVPSTPFGGDLPMRPDRGVTNYYGVGGYRGPLSDARTSGLRFAGECLAFANVPTEASLAELIDGLPDQGYVNHPIWKLGVARDPGAGWDFDDMRDHYLRTVFGLDPIPIRRGDGDRYLELSRAVTGEIMAYAFGEWRRTGSPCRGGLILWLRDLVGGAGWGVVDHRGAPKTAYHHLRRILAPTAVWLTDEMTGGVVAHVANDGPTPLSARLRVGLYSDLELPVGRGETAIELPAHGAVHHDVEAVIGRFVDAAWAFRFGPPAQDAIVVSLERDGAHGVELLSQAFHFPAGRPLTPERGDRLGLSASAERHGDGTIRLTVASRRLAYGVRIHVPGFATSDDAFSVEPGGTRTVALTPLTPDAAFPGGNVSALNLRGRVTIGERSP